MQGLFLGRTAGHRAAGVQNIPLQSNQLILMAVFFRQLHRFIQILHHNNAPQQVQCDLPKFFIKSDQVIGRTNDPDLRHDGVFPFQGSALNGRHRQESGPAQIVPFQVVDGILGILFRFRHHILQSAAQCRLNGSLIGLLHLQKLAHSAVNAPVLLIGQVQKAPYAVIKALMLLFHFHQEGQTGTGLGNALFLTGKAGLRPLFLLCRMASVLFQGRQLLFQITDMLFSVVFLFFQGLQVDFKLMQPALRIFFFSFQLFLSGQKLFLHGLPLGNFPLGLCANADLLKNLILEGLRLVFILGQGAAQGSIGFFQSVQFPLLTVHFQLQSVPLALTSRLFPLIFLLFSGFFRHFLLNTGNIRRIVLPLFFPQADLTFGLFHFCPQLRHFCILLLQKGIQFLAFFPKGSGRCLFPFAFLQAVCHLFPGCGFLPLQLFQLGADAFRILAESRRFRLFQMLPQPQVFLGLFALLRQRAHLHLQFADDVVHPQEVLLFLFQLMGRFIFSGFIFYDAGRFFKNTAAVIALCAQNLIDTPLADDGISFPAHARIHEQLLNILQPAGSAVDAVFALPGAEYPPGHLHLAVFQGQPAVLIVNQDGNLRKA